MRQEHAQFQTRGQRWRPNQRIKHKQICLYAGSDEEWYGKPPPRAPKTKYGTTYNRFANFMVIYSRSAQRWHIPFCEQKGFLVRRVSSLDVREWYQASAAQCAFQQEFYFAFLEN